MRDDTIPVPIRGGVRRRLEAKLPERAERFRAEVRDILGRTLPDTWSGIGALEPDAAVKFLHDWRRTLYENRLLAVAWPEEYGGRGLSVLEQLVVAQEMARAGVPLQRLNDDLGITLFGNTTLRWGTEEQKRHFLPRILSGEYVFCQGFSEPDSGSDLASLSTRAVRIGHEWSITGQKIWTSAAHTANWIFLLARTSNEHARHRGVSMLMCDLRQPNVEVRPLRMMSGMSEYNEVFFSEARTPIEHVLGEVNGGWRVAMTLLAIERGESSVTDPEAYRAEFDRLVDLARDRDVARDPVLTQRVAACYARVETMRYLGLGTLAALLRDGEPGPVSSLLKLYISRYHQAISELATDILGLDVLAPDGQLPWEGLGPDLPGARATARSWVATHLNARAETIYGGSAQIQRNIIGETLLGLPRSS